MLKPQLLRALPNVENFLRHCQRKVYKAKSPILKQGEIGDALYEQKKNKEATEEYLAAASAACGLVNKGDAAGAQGMDKLNADLARRTCDRASAGWSLASGEATKAFDKAFDSWYKDQLKLMDDGAKPASPYVRKR